MPVVECVRGRLGPSFCSRINFAFRSAYSSSERLVHQSSNSLVNSTSHSIEGAHRLWPVKSAASNRQTIVVDIVFCIACINWPESAMSSLDSSRPPNRNVLLLFYSLAFLSAIVFSAASYARASNHWFLLIVALAVDLAAVFFLVVYLRSRDEREHQINYRALTFAFVGTLVFLLVVVMAQQLGF